MPVEFDLDRVIVNAAEMTAIETRLFEAGFPVAALMEKVAGRIARWIQHRLGQDTPNPPHLGVLVGPGHNGGDALVVARELWFQGYPVSIYRPLDKAKPLTQAHFDYAKSLGIPIVDTWQELHGCQVILDGLFGFGQTRPIEGKLADLITWVNQQPQQRLSIDIPSGIHTDTGEVLGVAFHADVTLCLGLWKRGLFQDAALDILGEVQRLDFDIPRADVVAVLGASPQWQRITPESARSALPLPRPRSTHKYRQGQLLLIAGSRQYAGAASLAALGARASGVGMVTLAVPESLQPLLNQQVPEALVLACPETPEGAIAHLPSDCDLNRYDAIALGPGLTQQTPALLEAVLQVDAPLILDADGLNLLAAHANWNGGNANPTLGRSSPLILTPHPGEFRRLFPQLSSPHPGEAAQQAAQQSGALVVLKGARVVIASPDGSLTINPESTPALARGGSGDVLTGLMAGLVAIGACQERAIAPLVSSAVWWHAQGALQAQQQRSVLGVDAWTLGQTLPFVLKGQI
ncbi:MAG: NAD(P)H-hydrate dehydratase [Phormidium sp. BM_Day4_Bin.17]|nr:NAD(P)H-hydrate dehydratase [Phormidium sp. BM_Day4_Bin.17]UCJ14357.1 MAG: NAD(P)H-hydrate dehydratase [Phormidium sp. PBR-2020]